MPLSVGARGRYRDKGRGLSCLVPNCALSPRNTRHLVGARVDPRRRLWGRLGSAKDDQAFFSCELIVIYKRHGVTGGECVCRVVVQSHVKGTSPTNYDGRGGALGRGDGWRTGGIECSVSSAGPGKRSIFRRRELIELLLPRHRSVGVTLFLGADWSEPMGSGVSLRGGGMKLCTPSR